MSAKNEKLYKKFLEVVLTSLISIGIAYIQNVLNQNGVECGPNIDPQNAGVIGSVVGAVKVAFINSKSNLS